MFVFLNQRVSLSPGFSFTHVAPFVRGRRMRGATIRIDVGGKVLTNHLKVGRIVVFKKQTFIF